MVSLKINEEILPFLPKPLGDVVPYSLNPGIMN